MNRQWVACALVLAAGCERKSTELTKAMVSASAQSPAPPTIATPSAAASAMKKPIIDREVGSMGVKCTGEVLAGLKPAKPVDYLELRVELDALIHRQGTFGQKCAHATDARKCEALIEDAKPPVPLGRNPSCDTDDCPRNEYIIWQRGDEVGAVTGKDVATFLAPIDTASDAAATLAYTLAASTLAARDTQNITDCEPKFWTATADGWQGLAHANADGTTTQFVVKRDGAVSVHRTFEKR
jgi:hypothetical protein